MSKVGCPQSPLPPTGAVATSLGRTADGSGGDRQEVTLCDAATSPSLSPAQCEAAGRATKAYLELPTTLNAQGETFLEPCPRETSRFTAAQYAGWYAYQFPSACTKIKKDFKKNECCAASMGKPLQYPFNGKTEGQTCRTIKREYKAGDCCKKDRKKK